MKFSSLTPQQRERLKGAIASHPRSQEDLAAEVGYSSATISKFCSGGQARIRTEALRALLGLVGLDHRDFLTQLELRLNDRLEDELIQQVRSHFRRLQAETPVLRGSAFQGFVGIRVGGVVDKIFEGVFPLSGSD